MSLSKSNPITERQLDKAACDIAMLFTQKHFEKTPSKARNDTLILNDFIDKYYELLRYTNSQIKCRHDVKAPEAE